MLWVVISLLVIGLAGTAAARESLDVGSNKRAMEVVLRRRHLSPVARLVVTVGGLGLAAGAVGVVGLTLLVLVLRQAVGAG